MAISLKVATNFFLYDRKSAEKMMCDCCDKYKKALEIELCEYKKGKRIEELFLEEHVHWTAYDVEPLLDLAIERDHNTIKRINFTGARLPDSVGTKVARLVSKSSSLEVCMIAKNVFGIQTILTIVQNMQPALRRLVVHGNHCETVSSRVFDALVYFLERHPPASADEYRRWDLSKDFDDRHFYRLALSQTKIKRT